MESVVKIVGCCDTERVVYKIASKAYSVEAGEGEWGSMI